jgi:hypothetical protein
LLLVSENTIQALVLQPVVDDYLLLRGEHIGIRVVELGQFEACVTEDFVLKKTSLSR